MSKEIMKSKVVEEISHNINYFKQNIQGLGMFHNKYYILYNLKTYELKKRDYDILKLALLGGD